MGKRRRKKSTSRHVAKSRAKRNTLISNSNVSVGKTGICQGLLLPHGVVWLVSSLLASEGVKQRKKPCTLATSLFNRSKVRSKQGNRAVANKRTYSVHKAFKHVFTI